MHRKEFFQGLSRILTDFLSVILSWSLAYTIRPITDLIPNITYHFPIANLPNITFFKEFVFYTAIGFIFILFSLFLYSYNTTTATSKYFSWKIIGAYIWGIVLFPQAVLLFFYLYH